jgi:hypothetical protein
MIHHWNLKQEQQDGVHSQARTTNTSQTPEITPFLSFVSLIIFLLYIANIIGQQAMPTYMQSSSSFSFLFSFCFACLRPVPTVPNLVISLDWPFFVALSGFSDVYLNQNNDTLLESLLGISQ